MTARVLHRADGHRSRPETALTKVRVLNDFPTTTRIRVSTTSMRNESKTKSSSRRRKLKNQSAMHPRMTRSGAQRNQAREATSRQVCGIRRSEATRKHAREKHKKHKDAFDDLLDSGAEIFSILFNRYTTWHTPVYLISLCVLYTVSTRVPVSAAVATVGLTASVAAVLGGAGVSFNSFSSFSIPNFGKLVFEGKQRRR